MKWTLYTLIMFNFYLCLTLEDSIHYKTIQDGLCKQFKLYSVKNTDLWWRLSEQDYSHLLYTGSYMYES